MINVGDIVVALDGAEHFVAGFTWQPGMDPFIGHTSIVTKKGVSKGVGIYELDDNSRYWFPAEWLCKVEEEKKTKFSIGELVKTNIPENADRSISSLIWNDAPRYPSFEVITDIRCTDSGVLFYIINGKKYREEWISKVDKLKDINSLEAQSAIQRYKTRTINIAAGDPENSPSLCSPRIKEEKKTKFSVGQIVKVIGPGDKNEYFWAGDSTWSDWLDDYIGFTYPINSIVNSKSEYTTYIIDSHRFAEEWLEDVHIDIGQKIMAEEKNLHVLGAKDDAGKPPVALVFESFPRALLEVAKVAGHGKEKYTRGGWRHVEDAQNRYADAAGRHILRYYIDGEFDNDSGFYHIAHAAWNLLAVLELQLQDKKE